METQYKLAARSAQLLAKDAPQDEAARVMAIMATAKSQLSKVGIIYVKKSYLFQRNSITLTPPLTFSTPLVVTFRVTI